MTSGKLGEGELREADEAMRERQEEERRSGHTVKRDEAGKITVEPLIGSDFPHQVKGCFFPPLLLTHGTYILRTA
jgi:hypothetical protein